MSERAKLAAKTPDAKRENSISQTKKTNSSQSKNSPSDNILSLQRTVGNQAVEKLLKSHVIQAKLTIGQPGDFYEQEADRVAEEVMCRPDPSNADKNGLSDCSKFPRIQRLCAECEADLHRQTPPISSIQRKCDQCEKEDELQRKEITGENASAGGLFQNYIGSLSGSGQSLSEEVRNYYEPRFGYDFSQVRIHTDSAAAKSAQSINALAYTSGTNIVFNSQQYSPDTDNGKRLIAHELAHVVQQKGSEMVQRKKLTAEEKKEDLKSDFLKDDARLQKAFDNSPLLKKNETSEGVKTLQRALRRLNYPLPISFRKGNADGIFGDETKAQVQQFQRDNDLNDDGIVGRETLRVLDDKFNPVIFVESVFFGQDHKELIDNETDWTSNGNKYSDWAGSPYHILFTEGDLFGKTIPISVKSGETISGIAKVRVKGGIPGESYFIRSSPSGSAQGAANGFSLRGDGTFNKSVAEDTHFVGLFATAALGKKVSFNEFFLTWLVDAAGKTKALPVSMQRVFVVANRAINITEVRGKDFPNVPTFKRMERATTVARDLPTDDPGKIAFQIIKRFPSYGACAIPYDPQWDTADFKCPHLESIWEMSDFEGGAGHFQCITIANYTAALLNVLGVPNTVNVTVAPIVIWADKGSPDIGRESFSHQYNETHPRHRDWFLILVDGRCGLNNFEACVKLNWNAPNGSAITQYYCGGIPNKPGGFRTPTEILRTAFLSLSYVKRMSKNDPQTGFPRGIRMQDLAVYKPTEKCEREIP